MREDLDEATLRELHAALAADWDEWEQAAGWARAAVARGQAPARVHDGHWSAHPVLAGLPLRRAWEGRWLDPRPWTIMRSWAAESPSRLASVGTAAWRLGDLEQAASVLGEAIERGSRRAKLNLALLWLKNEPGHPRAARRLLVELREELREAAPAHAGSLQALALTLRTLGRLDIEHLSAPAAAADAFREAVLWGDLDSLVSLAQLERVAGDSEEALRMVRDAAREGSFLAAASLLADFDFDFDAAVENLDAAAVEGLGALLLRQGRREQAERAFAMAVAAGRLPARAQLGALLLEHDIAQAIEVLEPAVQRGSRAANLYLGRALLETQPERARGLMRTAYELGSQAAGEELLDMLREDGSPTCLREADELQSELDTT
jgi:tetratricopeptide (TPR) repeat protein